MLVKLSRHKTPKITCESKIVQYLCWKFARIKSIMCHRYYKKFFIFSPDFKINRVVMPHRIWNVIEWDATQSILQQLSPIWANIYSENDDFQCMTLQSQSPSKFVINSHLFIFKIGYNVSASIIINLLVDDNYAWNKLREQTWSIFLCSHVFYHHHLNQHNVVNMNSSETKLNTIHLRVASSTSFLN